MGITLTPPSATLTTDYVVRDAGVIKNILKVGFNATRFYQHAQADIQNPDILRHLAELEFLHRKIVKRLQQRLKEIGGYCAEGTVFDTFHGPLSHVFKSVYDGLNKDSDTQVIDNLIVLESQCLDVIASIICRDDVSLQTLNILQNQTMKLKCACDRLKLFKKIFNY